MLQLELREHTPGSTRSDATKALAHVLLPLHDLRCGLRFVDLTVGGRVAN